MQVNLTKKQILTLLKNKQTWLWMIALLAATFMVVFFIYLIVNALHQSTNINTYPTNGTFQLYNPLRRIAEGQIAGHDFPFFHGVGVPFLHLPVFSSLGGHVFAAEMAKWTVSPLLFLISSGLFFCIYFKEKRKALIATALFSILAMLSINVVYPGNSLVGLRSTFPIIVAAMVIWRTHKRITLGKYSAALNDILAVLFLGLAFVCGTEQGIAAILAFVILKAYLLRKTWSVSLDAVLRLTVIVIAISASVFGILSILTAGHALEALHYALIDIPNDQGWYYGAPPNRYLTWDNLIPGLTHYKMIPFYMTLVVALIGMYSLRKSKQSQKQIVYGFAFMIIYGIVVFIAGVQGYYEPLIQLLPLHRVVGLIAVALVVQFAFSNYLWSRIHKTVSKRHTIFATLKKILPYIIVIPLAAFLVLQTKTYVQNTNDLNPQKVLDKARMARGKDDYFPVNPSWKYRINKFKPYINESTSVWSTYTSLYDSHLSHSLNASPGGEDYIIHALGDERRSAYENAFITSKPEFAITVNPAFFVYEEWLMSRHWKFYDQLLTHYDLIEKNDSHYLWKLKEKPTEQAKPTIAMDPNAKTFDLPKNNSDELKVYEIAVGYTAKSNMTSLLDKLPRYFIYINNSSTLKYPVSLSARSHDQTFPIAVMPGETVSLKPSVDGIVPAASLDLQSISYKEVSVSSANKDLFLDNKINIGKRKTWGN